ncbi:hypothetical protein AB0N77_05820 [Streptomyces misionensis]|uniref:hypothetical protein n=1 Tax=Streptomyces misionensis TaxID=67331 RepID=UPI0033BB616B
MRTRTRIAPVAFAAVLVAGGTMLAAGQAGAAPKAGPAVKATCYGGAKYYTSTAGGGSSNAHWPATGTWAYTTSNCNDINVKSDVSLSVKVCFKKTGACNGWTSAKAGVWTVVAKDVLHGSGFYLQFNRTSSSKGWIAY